MLLLSIIVPSLFSLSLTNVPRDYVQSLRMLEGTPYETLNCAEYICVAKRHSPCAAADFWNDSCKDDGVVVQDVQRFEDIDQTKLEPGDVAAFHGVHVAAYIGNGMWMDSDFRHNGVGLMHRNHRPGGWFFGEVKIFRWKNRSWKSR
jgi:hypothetical protein